MHFAEDWAHASTQLAIPVLQSLGAGFPGLKSCTRLSHGAGKACLTYVQRRLDATQLPDLTRLAVPESS